MRKMNYSLPIGITFLLLELIPTITPFGVPFVREWGDHCDWRSTSDLCDQSRGLGCSYKTGACDCWDARTVYSTKVHRCVGKAGEECSYHESERLCTENAYCLVDDHHSLSPFPVCVCLKGYFRTENGSCIKYSKQSEPCDPYPPSRIACEPETGLKCYGYTCQCDPDHIFDPERHLCIAKAGRKCSRTLNNCIENAECVEKMWALDHSTGATQLAGYRCACKPGLKVTSEGMCASDYGGICNKTSECFPGENLTCLNNVCQCHPISQIYDKKLRRCFNLVGTKCQPEGNLEDFVDSEKNVNSTVTVKNASRTNTKISSSFNSSSSSSFKKEAMEGECIPNSACVFSSSQKSYHCQCVNGSSETTIKTCLKDYGESCRSSLQAQNEIQSRMQIFALEEVDMKCNIFEGLICHSDAEKCLCADPSLVYDEERRACVARVGNPCGNLRLGMLDLTEEIKEMIFINCEKNSTCLEQHFMSASSRRVCVPLKYGASSNSLTKFMLDNAVITEAD